MRPDHDPRRQPGPDLGDAFVFWLAVFILAVTIVAVATLK